jgi:restriction system-associated AAA family ATPase
LKLIRLKIDDPKGFRSFQPGFEIRFLKELNFDKIDEFNPYVIAGRNGSGKSNILEVLASIFYHIECCHLNYRPDNFEYDEETNPNGFRAELAAPDAFVIEYFFPFSWDRQTSNARILIKKESQKEPEVHWINRGDFEDKKETKLSSIEIKKFLPSYIIGYSSGQNEILSLPFFKMRFIHYDEYKDSIKNQTGYRTQPEGRLVFLDNDFSQAVLLSNLLLQDKEILKPFDQELGIEDIKTFRIIIRTHIKSFDEDFPKTLLEENEDEFGETYKTLKITQQLQTAIDKLKKCSTCQYYEYSSEMLYLDYKVNAATKEAFNLHFGNPIDLFKTFQILLTLNLFSVSENLKKELYESSSLYVNETVPVLPSDERIFRFKDFVLKKKGISGTVYNKSLSDGEHQFLHAIGLSLLFREENALILLDEPETHFNPDWRAKFISTLRDCFKTGHASTTMREMLITTHTPYMISDSRPEHVLLCDKSFTTNNIKVTNPDFNTLGASINKITMKAFGKLETIGGYAETLLDDIKKRFEAGESKQALLDEVNALLGDSVEKILFIKRILNSMEKK